MTNDAVHACAQRSYDRCRHYYGRVIEKWMPQGHSMLGYDDNKACIVMYTPSQMHETHIYTMQ